MPATLNPLPIYPVMTGLTFPVVRVPAMKTNIQECVSGRESAVGMWSFPRWKYTLTYSFLTQTDYDTIVNFFLAQRGRANPFWFDDRNANTLTNSVIGIADGVTKDFQITRLIGNINEPVFGTKANMVVTSAGHSSIEYNITAGKVSFTTAPASGSGNITVSGGYYARVRFKEDEMNIEEFMYQLHELKTVELLSVK